MERFGNDDNSDLAGFEPQHFQGHFDKQFQIFIMFLLHIMITASSSLAVTAVLITTDLLHSLLLITTNIITSHDYYAITSCYDK